MATLIDTNVLIDVAVGDPVWRAWSRARMIEARSRGSVLINQIIYSEFSTRYASIDEVDAILDPDEFRRENLPWEASFAAARAFRAYRDRGGQRDRVLPDFLIGAHATIRGYDILTRDPSGYRRYFPTVAIISPETHP